ncbi:hypothetical protein [Microbacterium paulum]
MSGVFIANGAGSLVAPFAAGVVYLVAGVLMFVPTAVSAAKAVMSVRAACGQQAR